MDIKKVELLVPDELQEQMGAKPSFSITTDENMMAVLVPTDSTNANYWLVKEWYDNQETKPFDFQFEQMPEPEFEDTIYPPEPEENEEGETEE